MTCYQLAEISISVGPTFEHDIQIFSAGRVEFCAGSLQIVHYQLNYIYYLHNVYKCNKWASRIHFLLLILFFWIFRWFKHFTVIFILIDALQKHNARFCLVVKHVQTKLTKFGQTQQFQNPSFPLHHCVMKIIPSPIHLVNLTRNGPSVSCGSPPANPLVHQPT